MSENRLTLTLRDPQTGHTAWVKAWAWCKAMLFAGHALSVEITKDTRSAAQNRILHSRIGDIASQKLWAGAKRSTDVWKRLLTAAWLRERGESVEFLPALDGHGVDVVFRHTSSLTRAESAELSDWIMAYGDAEGIRWCRASLGRDAPDDAAPARQEETAEA